MFEAHTLSESDLATTITCGKPVAEGHTYTCWHSLYQCNLRYWFAKGKRNGIVQRFLFIEFKNRDNTHGYCKLELPDTPLSQKQAGELISSVALPASLDPIKTEHWSTR